VYEAFFGLVDAPFRLTPDPRFLFLSAKHAEALAHLRLGLTEPGGFVCITGEIGTGKTTVLRSFLADLGPEVATAFIFNPTLSWEDLLQRITRELGVPTTVTSHVDLMDALNAHLLAQRKEGRIAVVVIDEAQAMPLEVLERLRLLSNLETSTEKLLRLVLVGQPQLARLLLDPALAQLNQRITLRWHLRPLTRAETFTYVRHRLVVAGGPAAAGLFTAAALRLVHRYSGGVPRLVNMIAHRAALAAYVARTRRVRVRAVRAAYREIRTVPLVTTSRGRRLGWVAGAAAACVALAIGLPRLSPELERFAARSGPMPVAVDAPAVAATPKPPDPPPPAVRIVRDEVAPQLEDRLERLDPVRSLRDATATVLAAWRVGPLGTDDVLAPGSLEAVAHRRGLEDLRLTGNLSMLRLLDLPAVLELRLPGTNASRFAALTAVDDDQATLVVGEGTVSVPPAELDRVWFGDAHVLWRDFEWLGPTFGREAKGPHVTRLQGLLARAGIYDGAATGTFDQPTQHAVIEFQRSRRLDPDCRVGRLTRIALYGAAGRYQLPSLAANASGRSGEATARARGGGS
jgi:general secretion pathway protein A